MKASELRTKSIKDLQAQLAETVDANERTIGLL